MAVIVGEEGLFQENGKHASRLLTHRAFAKVRLLAVGMLGGSLWDD